MESFGLAEECSGCGEESFGFGNVLAVGLISICLVFCFGLQLILFASMISTGVLLRLGDGAVFQFIICERMSGGSVVLRTNKSRYCEMRIINSSITCDNESFYSIESIS